MKNFLVVMKPKMTGDGSYVMSKPWPTATSTSSIPLIDIEDTGKYIQPFLNDPKKYNHAILTASTAFYTPAEISETWTKVTGHEVKFDEEHDDVSHSGMTQDQKDAFVENSVARESTYYGPGGREHLEWTLAQMEERPSTWETFVKRNESWF